MSRRARSLVLATLLALLAPSAAAEVHIVDAKGGGDFISIAVAVANASDGDLILVRSGTYPSFTVNGLDLAVFADAGATVVVNDVITVTNLPAGKSFVLGGLDVRGLFSSIVSTPALRITNALGSVRLVDCILRGGDGKTHGAGQSNPGAIAIKATTYVAARVRTFAVKWTTASDAVTSCEGTTASDAVTSCR